MMLDELYQLALTQTEDIDQHMPVLAQYAQGCDHITEFGVRAGCSTAALLLGRPFVLISYDIMPFEHERQYREVAEAYDIIFEFRRRDSCAAPIDPTDMLFIDTIHTYAQLDRELQMHAGRVHRFIAMHDTYSVPSESSPENNGAEMWVAIRKLLAGGEWRVHYDCEQQHGLTILARA